MASRTPDSLFDDLIAQARSEARFIAEQNYSSGHHRNNCYAQLIIHMAMEGSALQQQYTISSNKVEELAAMLGGIRLRILPIDTGEGTPKEFDIYLEKPVFE